MKDPKFGQVKEYLQKKFNETKYLEIGLQHDIDFSKLPYQS